MTHPAHHHTPSLLRILGWLLLALVLAGLAVAIDGCTRPIVFHAPIIGRPLPIPTRKAGKR
jgi:hypothetical protein